MNLVKKYKNLKGCLSVFSFVVLFSFLSACTKDIPKLIHEKDLSISTISNWHPDFLENSDQKEADLFTKNMHDLTIDLIKEGSRIKNNPESLMTNVVIPLSERFLSEKIFKDGFIDTKETRDIFGEFNKFLLITLENVNTRAKALKIVKSYDNLIFSGCTQNKGCKNINFFQKVLKTKLIVLSPIKYKSKNRCKLYENIEDYYKRLEMAYVLLEPGVDYPLIDSYYFQCSLEYVIHLSDDYISTQSIDILKKRDNLLLNLQSILRRPKRIWKTEEEKNIFHHLSEQLRSISNKANKDTSSDLLRIINKLKKWTLETALKLDINDDEFHSILKDIHDDFYTSKNIFSYHYMLDEINEKNPNLIRSMNINILNIKENPYLKILDFVINREWTYDVANGAYKKIENKEEMKKNIKGFLDLIIIYSVNKANWRMRPIFMETELESEELVKKINEIEVNIKRDITEAYNRFSTLKSFANKHLSSEESLGLGLSDKHFKSSVDYLLSHPHSMLIKHKLAKIRFNGKIEQSNLEFARTPYLLRNIEFNKIYPEFFLGPTEKVPPEFFLDDFEHDRKNKPFSLVFDYASFLSEPVESFTPYQRLHAFYFLIRTDLLYTTNISFEDFLKDLIDGMLLEYEKLVDDGYKRLLHVEGNMQGSLNDVNLFCEEENKRKESFEKSEIYNTDSKYSFKINILNLDQGNLIQSNPFKDLFLLNDKIPPSGSENKSLLIHTGETSLALFRVSNSDRLDTLRLGEAELMRHIRLLLKIYKDFRSDMDIAPSMSSHEKETTLSKIDKQISSFKKSIERYKHKKRKFYTLLRKYNKFILSGCYNLLIARAIQINDSVYLKEIEYLRQVYKSKIALDKLSGEERELYYKEEIEPGFRFKKLDEILWRI